MPKFHLAQLKKRFYFCITSFFMASDKILTSKKYQDIRTAYDKWLAKKYKGKQIYTDLYIYLKLSEKFYLSPRTIENIVYHRTKLVDRSQLSMF